MSNATLILAAVLCAFGTINCGGVDLVANTDLDSGSDQDANTDLDSDSDLMGTVQVTTNNDGGSYTIYTVVGAPVAAGSGSEVSTFELDASPAPGIGYRIEFSEVAGCISPQPINFNLEAGNSLAFLGVYQCQAEPSVGTIQVSTNLETGSYTLYTVVGTHVASGSGSEVSSFELDAVASPGMGYRIVFGEVENCTTPQPIYFNLVTDEVETFIGEYSC